MSHPRIRRNPVPRRAYRIDEVCEALALGRGKVGDLMDRGILKRIKVDNLVLISADSLETLLRGAAE